jgi:tetratricopeptide (TPR) repeat protein
MLLNESSTVLSPWHPATVARMKIAQFFWLLEGAAPKRWTKSRRSINSITALVQTITESLTYYELRDYPRLIEASKRGLILDSQDSFQHYLLGVGYEGVGDLQQAISEYKKASEISSGFDLAAVALAHADSALGKKAEAEKILRDLEHKKTSASPYTMATVYALLGDNDKTLEFLEKACSGKSLDITLFVQSDFALDSLRSDPRFQSLLRRIGLKT